ncbi:MAG: type Z 30S ribosomal protein S14 [Cyanobacteria bacterium HKST-UBA06]|nr:type Z 30S ribosomal protein S14 [Cyanobacteria bacterium HKST-UBA05]MCA9798288.1 type Z 30S ribosomal protein S14 [Cyanobacteria bacterium HKST-UBA04]MCA9806973.1 type Z 30S ribosomal protein S14 [Cyanobacteria bacterium HKST-UBA06]MCA9841714.1 type Z 30S ribosomal protein S14 [Cyanobacteria bacterium HKST-UBA03]
MVDKEAKRRRKVSRGKLSKVKLRNRCSICGRPRAYYRFFGTCRLCLRKLAHEGKLPGVLKASW